MDSRTAAHTLSQIAAYLELQGENRFKSKAYTGAARALLALDADDLAPLLRSGELEDVSGLGPATLSVVRDLVESGESRYLERLRESVPQGVLELLRVPGLTPAKIRLVHEELGVDSLDALERAANDGRLAKLPKWGPKTAAKILAGIQFLRSNLVLVRLPRALAEAERIAQSVRGHPQVTDAQVAGDVRRRCEVAGALAVVAGCNADPIAIAASFTRAGGVREVEREGTANPRIRYVDDTVLDLACVPDDEFAVAVWRHTGSDSHVHRVAERLAARGMRLDGDRLLGAGGVRVPVPDEHAIYRLAELQYVEPELREDRGEIESAAARAIPTLVTAADLRGVLHCHSVYSDGVATIAELADGARSRGWSYIGITDHSEAAFYASGIKRDRLHEQQDEIDELNARATDGFRILKGVECDILADGQLDYDENVRASFDFVVASVHSRFSMDEATMTARVLRALDDPTLTILGHPTGRLLLSREPYAIDMNAVIEKAAAVGAAIELNADPARLDLDWRMLHDATQRGVTIEIGPDAHSVAGLDNVQFGIDVGRKGWLAPHDVLNARSADDVLQFAKRRRS